MNASVASPVELTPVVAGDGRAWSALPALIVLAVVLALLAVYHETAASIVAIWARSDTFVHGFVVIPICLWLAWERRAALAALDATPWWPAAGVVAASGAMWLVMTLGNVTSGRQFALAFMLLSAIVTVLGRRISRKLCLPLLFLLFAVPAGEFLIPTLIDWTANFTIAALRASGVPVYREGNQFVIPSGSWSVVEACSGVRYLIASTMVGVIYAAVAYQSMRRRVLFVLASILVPIVANWLRAYMIVMIGHLSNNTLAMGVDHLIYGWLFFGFVMLLLFWVGSWWREPEPEPQSLAAATHARSAHRLGSYGPVIAAAMVVVVLGALWQPVEARMHSPVVGSPPVLMPLPATSTWSLTPSFTHWKPRYQGFAKDLQQTFSGADTRVGVYIAYYFDQRKGSELVTSENLMVARDDWVWKQVTEDTRLIDWAGQPVTAEHVVIAGGSQSLDVLSLFWSDGQVTASPYVAKARMSWAKLMGRRDDSALIVLYAAHDARAGEALAAFARGMTPQIKELLAAAAARQP